MLQPETAAPIESLDDLEPRHRRQAMRLVTASALFGTVWSTTVAGSPFTLFAHGLGASEWHFGLLVAMPFLATLLSLPASLWIDASGARKAIFLVTLFTQRLLWLAIAIAPTLLHRRATLSHLALPIFLALMAAHYITGAIGGPAWVSWMADLVPSQVRGRFFANRRQWGVISSTPAAVLVGVALQCFAKDGETAMLCAAGIFCVTAVAGVIDISLFVAVPHVAPKRSASGGSAFVTLLRPLKDRAFVWFCLYVATLTMAVAPMGQFTNLFLVERLHIGATQVQLMLLVAPLIGQFLLVPIWGRMADRFGRKPMMALSTFGLVPVGLGWCLMSLDLPGLGYLLAALGSVFWAAIEIANFNFVIDLSGSGDGECSRGSGYMSMNSAISAVAGAIGGVGAGALMHATRDVHLSLGGLPIGSFEILFASSAALRLIAGSVFLPKLAEPTRCTPREAIGFVASNLYNNVVGVVRGPIRRLSRALVEVEPETIEFPRPQPQTLQRAA